MRAKQKRQKGLSLKIELLLKKTKYGLTASEIASKIDSNRGTVNSILYAKTPSIFQKIEGNSPSKWRLSGLIRPVEEKQELLRNEVLETIEIKESEVETNKEVGPPCSFCGQLSIGLFCSTRCRNQATNQWRLSKILPQDFRETEQVISFVLLNPTCPFDQYQTESIRKKCKLHNSHTLNFLDLWIEHEQNLVESVRCLKQAAADFEIRLQVDDGTEAGIEIAIADLSKSCRAHIRLAFKNRGLLLENTALVSVSQIENLDSLSASVKTEVNSVVERKKDLFSELAEKKIDEFTLRFLGISSELFQWINLKRPIRADLLELLSSNRPKITSSELRDEFVDLLIALESHPFLPTQKILENLEIWTLSQFFENSCVCSRLIETLKETDGKKLGSNKKQGLKLLDRLLRRFQILDGVLEGHTLEQIGEQIGVTRERIRQLLIPVFAHAGVDDLKSLRLKPQEHRQLVAVQKAREESDFETHVTQYVREHPGISVAELNVIFPGNDVKVLSVAKRHRALVLSIFPIQKSSKSEIRADIIQSLRDASLLAFPLTGISYDELLEQGLIKGVSRQRIMQVFRSWIAACENAEVEPGSVLQGVTYIRTYSYKDMLKVVAQFLIDDDSRGYTGGMQSYGVWRASQELGDSLPSPGTIRNQIDASWKRIKELALVELRTTWTSRNGVGSERHDE